VSVQENILGSSVSDPTDIISEEKLYELGLDQIKHTKDKRDEINRFFISLFSIFLSVAPFISHITESIRIPFGYSINIALVVISILGICLSISWISMLRYTILLLRATEHFVMYMERRHGKKLLTYISEFLHVTDAPARVTIQEMYISYAFLGTFVLMFISSVAYMIIQYL
jgi:hypothetical protein